MARTRPPDTSRIPMVELVHAGRPPEELAQEFEPTAQSIRNWVAKSGKSEPNTGPSQ
jgi:transposase